MRSLLATVCLAFVAFVAGCAGAPSSLFHAAGYYVRGDTVYYLDSFPGDAFTIDNADPMTFKILNTAYAKDKSSVYLDGAPLADADAASFVLLEVPDFAEDSGHVFVRDHVLSTDPGHFEFLNGDGAVTKDSAHVYWSDGTVLSDDPAHFKILSDVDHYLFAEDGSTVYVNGNPIKEADPATFTLYGGGAYAKDADAVYYFTERVADADAATFKVLAAPYARDGDHAYWMGKVVPDADPQTFVVLNANFECTADSAHAYYRDMVIKDFDPRTIPKGTTVTNCSDTSLSYS